MDLKEAYATLEVAFGATLPEVKAAYRLLAQVWHPDRFTHNAELQRVAGQKLTRINLAYECVKTAAALSANPAESNADEGEDFEDDDDLDDDDLDDDDEFDDDDDLDEQVVLYHDACWYVEGDLRLNAGKIGEMEAAIAVMPEGIMLAILVNGQPIGFATYDRDKILSVSHSDIQVVRQVLPLSPPSPRRDTELFIHANVHTGTVCDFTVRLRFRNSILSQQFIRQAADAYALRVWTKPPPAPKPEPQPPPQQPAPTSSSPQSPPRNSPLAETERQDATERSPRPLQMPAGDPDRVVRWLACGGGIAVLLMAIVMAVAASRKPNERRTVAYRQPIFVPQRVAAVEPERHETAEATGGKTEPQSVKAKQPAVSRDTSPNEPATILQVPAVQTRDPYPRARAPTVRSSPQFWTDGSTKTLVSRTEGLPQNVEKRSGTILWTYPTGDRVRFSPSEKVIGWENNSGRLRVRILDSKGKGIRHDPYGSFLFKGCSKEVVARAKGTPAIADGSLWLYSVNNKTLVVTFGADGNLLMWSYKPVAIREYLAPKKSQPKATGKPTAKVFKSGAY